MPDLQQLLIEESSRLRPHEAPPFGELVHRHRLRSRRRRLVATGVVALAVASGAVLVPQLSGATSTERLAQPTTAPTPAVPETPFPKQAPPGVGATFAVRAAGGEPLPGNEWELVADPSASVTVELSRSGPPDLCLLYFEVVPEGGGSPVGGLRTPPPEGGGTGNERYQLTWTAQDPELRPLPSGRYRLIARTQAQDEDTCGNVGYRGPKNDVQTSLGLFVVPSP